MVLISFSNKFLEAIDCNASLTRQTTRPWEGRRSLKERDQSYVEEVASTRAQMEITAGSAVFSCCIIAGSCDVRGACRPILCSLV